MNARHVLLLVAPARRPWTSDVARWATSGVLRADAVSCLSVDEVRAVVGSGRNISVVLADAGTPGLDRDTVAGVTAAGAAVLVVDDGRNRRDWEAIGCAELLPAPLTSDVLADALDRHGRTVDPLARRSARISLLDGVTAGRGRLVSVTGHDPRSSALIAIAAAEGRAGTGRTVALVDGCRRSPLTVLHDPGPVVPGLAELVDLCRADAPDPAVVRDLLRQVPARRYDLLLGLRRPREWTLLRPLAVQAALDALLRSYDDVVVHHDPDLDDESATGSVDVEERHAISLAAVRSAGVVVVVDQGDLAGVQAASSVRADLLDAGVADERLLTVAVCPRPGGGRWSPISRVSPPHGHHLVATVPRRTTAAHLSVSRLPGRLVRAVAAAIDAVDDGSGPGATTTAAHRVRPGELGTRIDGEVA